MKLSTLIEKTSAAKAAEKASRIKDGYKTVLNILEDEIQGAEILPGAMIKLIVSDVFGDEFYDAMKDIGSDVLQVGTVRIWRSTTSRCVISVEGVRPDHIDEDWEALIDEIKDRVEIL